ncbi:MAG: LysM peptidoglycan-binding domain-containing protein [Elusimicrobia bacterium]|nr:LysM peptidoglycan-binding domain-containing protein [Elusimicrobiota bacterium]
MAQSEIKDAKRVGAEVSEAEDALSSSRAFLNEGKNQQALNEANRAYELARSAKEAIAGQDRLKEDAAAAIERAAKLIDEAKSLGGNLSVPETSLASARSYFEAEDYPLAIEYADRAASEANALLANLRGDRYTVGSWTSDRDCLWNIAAKPSIYKDAWKWKRIYKANQDKIKNPDIIYPGQILIIPRD